MARMHVYQTQETKTPKGNKTIYHAGHVFVVDDDVAQEWMVGSPPAAWPEGQERPPVWPEPIVEEDDDFDPDVDDDPGCALEDVYVAPAEDETE